VTTGLVVPAGFAGTVTVTLVVTDANGCSGMTTHDVVVHELPVADLVITPIEACRDPLASTTFDLDASGSSSAAGIADPSGYAWTVSAGTLTPSSGARVTLNVPPGYFGTIDVTVDVTDGNGCGASITRQIEVHEGPTIVQPLSVVDVCADMASGQVVSLAGSATSPDGIVRLEWTTTEPLVTITPTGLGTADLQLPAGYSGVIPLTLEADDGSDCATSVPTTLTVVASPSVVVQVTPPEQCADPAAPVTFDLDATGSTAPDGISTYAFTTSEPAATITPIGSGQATLALPGGYSGTVTVTTTVTSLTGCVASGTVDVPVHPQPVARITTSLARACSGATAPSVTFDGASSSAIAPANVVSWAWSLTGPATPSTSNAPSFTATFPIGTSGTFMATLVVTDSRGCAHSTTEPVTIIDSLPPVASVVASDLTPCASASGSTVVNLDASSSTPPAGETIAGFSWSASAGTLGGSTGSAETLTTGPGLFGAGRVDVTVTASNGCQAMTSIDLWFVEPPQPIVIVAPASQCELAAGASFSARSDGSASNHPTDPALSYAWSAAEGTFGQPTAASSTYLVAATGIARDVAVQLDVTDAAGCMAQASQLAHLDPLPLAGFTTALAPIGAPSLFMAVDARPGLAPFSYAWSFGDGDTATGAGPSHIYTTVGTYTVQLDVTDVNGCSASASQVVTVGQLTGTVVVDVGCAGAPTELVATITGGTAPYAFDWLFGDGDSDTTTAASTMHAYLASGSYAASAKVIDALGASVELSFTIDVPGPPVVTLSTAGPALIDEPQSFHVASPEPIASIAWTFSDGATGAGADVTHAFTSLGPVFATATVVGANGCEAVATINLEMSATTTEIAFAKGVSTFQIEAGGEVEYVLSIVNGEGRARDVTIEDDLPSGFEMRPGSLRRDGVPQDDPPNRENMTLEPFDLEAGAVSTIRYRAWVRPDVPAGDYDNSATLRATDALDQTLFVGPRIATVRVMVTDERPGYVDLRIDKRADPDPDPPGPGGLVRYVIEYANVGTAPATGVRLQDDWPEELTTMWENGDGGTVFGGQIEWDIRLIPAGAIGRVQYTLRLNDDLGDGVLVSNVALISSTEPDEHPEDNRDSADVAVGGFPDLALQKTVSTSPDPAVPGADVTYVLTWVNNGAAVARGAYVVDDYDETKIEIVGLTSGVDLGGQLRFDLGDAARGDGGSLTYTARVLADATGAVENVANIAAELPDDLPSDNRATARFDVVLYPAELTISGQLRSNRRCHQPQVEVALRSDTFDTAAAMRAAAALLRASHQLAGSEVADDVILAADPLPRLLGRMRAFARLNVESLFLHSGMGIGWQPVGRDEFLAETARAVGLEAPEMLAAPVTLPYRNGHPMFDANRDLDEPWCLHDVHRQTTGLAIGESLAAIAAYADDARLDPSSERQYRATVLLAQAARIVAVVSEWRRDSFDGIEHLPCSVRVTNQDDGSIAIELEDRAPRLEHQAAVVKGMFRLATAAENWPYGDQAELVARARQLGRTVLDDLGRQLDAAIVTEDDDDAADGALAGAIDAVRIAAGGDVPASILARLERRVSARASASSGSVPLATELATMAAARTLGDDAAARTIWRRLERDRVEPRLGIYRTDPGSDVMTYSPRTVADVTEILTGLAVGQAVVTAAPLVQRIAATIDKVTVQAGMQTGLLARRYGEQGLRLLLGGDGSVRATAVFADAPHDLAPVFLDRVRFQAEAVHHRDLSLIEAARGLQAEGAYVSYFASQPGDCRTARARLLDRSFRTDTGLLAIDRMETAGRVLARYGVERRDPLLEQFGGELQAMSYADRVTLSAFAGFGIRLRHAPSVGGTAAEGALVRAYATAAGLAVPPEMLLPTWLEPDSGDPAFPRRIEPSSAYTEGWDRTSFAGTVSPTTLGQSLVSDVRFVRAALERDGAIDRLLGRLRLHAATLKVELIADDLRKRGDVTGYEPVVDAEGHVVRLARSRGRADLGGRAALLEGLARYVALVADGAPYSEASPPLAARAAREGLAARVAARTLSDSAPAAVLSPLAHAAIVLEATAIAGEAAEVTDRYRAMRDRFLDRTWHMFVPGEDSETDGGGGRSFVLTDLDVGVTLGALAAAMPHLGLSDREEAADLIYAAGGRMLFESGLQRSHRLTVESYTGERVARAPQLSRAVKITIADSPAQIGTLYPGDLVFAAYRLENPVESSVASDSALDVAVAAGLQYVPGSARLDGSSVGEPAIADRIQFQLGRLGGGQAIELTWLMRIAPDATPAPYKVIVTASARTTPGPEGQPIPTTPDATTLDVESFGGVEGSIWIDTDGDGLRSAGEPGVPDVTVQLDDGTTAMTREEGRYRLSSLVPAGYAMRLLEHSLSAPIRPVGTGETRVRVRSGVIATADFAMRSMADMTGIVYRDENGNRRWDTDESVVAGVVVESSNGRRSVTDRTGRYLIRGVEVGKHRLGVARQQPFVRDDSDLRMRPLALPQPDVSALRGDPGH